MSGMALHSVLLLLPLLFDAVYAKTERLVWKDGKCYQKRTKIEVNVSKCRSTVIVACSIVGAFILVLALAVCYKIWSVRKARKTQLEKSAPEDDAPPPPSYSKSEKPIGNPEQGRESPPISMPVPDAYTPSNETSDGANKGVKSDEKADLRSG